MVLFRIPIAALAPARIASLPRHGVSQKIGGQFETDPRGGSPPRYRRLDNSVFSRGFARWFSQSGSAAVALSFSGYHRSVHYRAGVGNDQAFRGNAANQF